MGVDAGTHGSLREAVLIKSLRETEELENIKFLTLLSAISLSSGTPSADQIKNFKDLLSSYGEAFSNKKKERTEFLESSTHKFEDMLKKWKTTTE